MARQPATIVITPSSLAGEQFSKIFAELGAADEVESEVTRVVDVVQGVGDAERQIVVGSLVVRRGGCLYLTPDVYASHSYQLRGGGGGGGGATVLVSGI